MPRAEALILIVTPCCLPPNRSLVTAEREVTHEARGWRYCLYLSRRVLLEVPDVEHSHDRY